MILYFLWFLLLVGPCTAATNAKVATSEKFPFGTLPTAGSNTSGCANQEESIPNLSLGIFLIVGTIISYIPQLFVIVYKKSSLGVSPMWLLLSLISGFENIQSEVMTQWDKILCCETLSFWGCNNILLALYQLASGWVCLTILEILILIYYEAEPSTPLKQEKKEHFMVFLGFLFYLTFLIVCLLLGFLLLFATPNIDWYTDFLGVTSTILNVIMWTPQIWMTYKLNSAANLSLTMLLLQAPGSVLTVIFIVLSGENFTVWLPNLITGVEQTVLLLMVIYYMVRDYKLSKKMKALPSPDSDSSVHFL